MGIAKSQFKSILSNIFKVGNKIDLYSIMPNENTELGGVKISGDGYEAYTIKDGDFSVTEGEVQSAKNMMLYLCEAEEGHGDAVGFGVFSGNDLLYFGTFLEPMPIGYNSVPTIKKYDSTKNEGIHITMKSTEITEEASAAAE